jgi:hypothetical protein
MLVPRIARILTASAFIFMCVPVICSGWNIANYSVASIGLDSSENHTEVLQPWTYVSGLAFSARDASLTAVIDWDDEKQTIKRRDEEAEILAIRPLSSEYWLLLSDMRFITGEASNKMVEALNLSILTGPNEGRLMFQRGKFGVLHWEALPPEFQKRAATDLASSRLSEAQISSVQKALSGKTEKVRQEVRTALEAQGLSANGITALGL